MLYSPCMKKYFYHKIENLLLVNKIVTLHRFSFDKSFASPGESHNFWEIVFAARESLVCEADGREIILEEGEALFHKPNEHHILRANGWRDPQVLVVSFECKSEAMRFFEGKKLRPDERCLRLLYAVFEEGERTFDMAVSDPDRERMELLSAPTLGGEQLIKNYLEQLLIYLLRTSSECNDRDLVPQMAEEVPLVAAIKEYLIVRREENVRVEDICRAFGYSKSFLSRLFREHTGTSLAAYAAEKKMERARELIREGNLNFTQIAAALSFEDPQYFSRSFKKICGMTPTEYKNKAHI